MRPIWGAREVRVGREWDMWGACGTFVEHVRQGCPPRTVWERYGRFSRILPIAFPYVPRVEARGRGPSPSR